MKRRVSVCIFAVLIALPALPEEHAGGASIRLLLLLPEDAGGRPALARGAGVFPKGAASGRLALFADDEPFPAAIAVRALWPDGSIMAAGVEAFIPAEKTRSSWRLASIPAEQAAVHRPSLSFTVEDKDDGRFLVVETDGRTFKVPGGGTAPFLCVEEAPEDRAYPEITVLEKSGRARRFSTDTARFYTRTRMYADPEKRSLQIVREGCMRASVHGFEQPKKPLLTAPCGKGDGMAVVSENEMRVYLAARGAADESFTAQFASASAAALDTGTGHIYAADRVADGAVVRAFDFTGAPKETPSGLKLAAAPRRMAAFRGIVVVDDGKDGLSAFEASSGKALWDVKVPGRIIELAAGRGVALALVE